MKKETLLSLANSLPTPAYVFDTDLFRQRAALVREAFGEKTGLCFSIKANPFLLAELPEIFDKIEVCSPGELTICEKTDADMAKVIFSGVNKTAPDVRRAMDDQVGTFTAESLMHVRLINEAALECGWQGLCYNKPGKLALFFGA
jgi:diaminopimelate decarboxylase